MRTQIALVSLAAGSIASASAAQVISFNDSSLFTAFAVQNGAAVSTEGFDSYTGFGSTFTGDLGGVQWLASAAGGMYAQAGLMSTNNPEAMTFSFGGSGVKGVGGQFFSTDINFNFVPSTIYVTLSDGSGFVGAVTSGTQFTGFWSLGTNISSIRVQPLGGSSSLYPTADSLSIAVVPAPGAVALLALAGSASRRRRRA